MNIGRLCTLVSLRVALTRKHRFETRTLGRYLLKAVCWEGPLVVKSIIFRDFTDQTEVLFQAGSGGRVYLQKLKGLPGERRRRRRRGGHANEQPKAKVKRRGWSGSRATVSGSSVRLCQEVCCFRVCEAEWLSWPAPVECVV